MLHRVLMLLCLFSVLLLAGCSATEDPALKTEGGCVPSSSPFLEPAADMHGRISFCAPGDDAWQGTLRTEPYPAGTRHVEILLAGYPGNPGVTLRAVANDGQARATLATPLPRERWDRVMLDIPDEVARTGYRLELEDASSEKFGWAGLGSTTTGHWNAFVDNALPVLAGLLAGNVWLIALALLLPATYLPRERLLVALLVGGGAWMAIFVAYVASAYWGGALALALLTIPLPLALLKCLGSKGDRSAFMAMQALLLPVLLLSGFVLWVGLFPFHWDGVANGDPALRWPHLSTDAWLPMMFGDMLARGHVDSPMAGDWLSSDRPPLQVGVYLLVHALLPHSRELVYQGISTWAQALVLLPISALLARYLNRRAQQVALFTLCLSPMLLLNTLYVWPKLLAATFCLIYYMDVFPAEGTPRRWARAGTAAALALLSHGGALFFLVGVSLVNLAWYRRRSLIMLLRAAPVALAWYLPWVGYQKLIDPPGDRLLKWHFAGKIPVSDEGTLHAIMSAYSQLSVSEWAAGRLANLAVITTGAFEGPVNYIRILFRDASLPWTHFIDNDFFHTFHSMGFASPLLLLPCLVVLHGRHQKDSGQGSALHGILQMTLSVATFIGVWATVLFEARTATINTGGYAGVVMLQLVVLVAAWRTSPPLFFGVCAANVMVVLSAYVLDRHFLPGLHALYVFGALTLCAGLLGAIIIASRFDSGSPTQHPCS